MGQRANRRTKITVNCRQDSNGAAGLYTDYRYQARVVEKLFA